MHLECRISKFQKQIRNRFEEESSFIDASYASKAGKFQMLYDERPKYVPLDEIYNIVVKIFKAFRQRGTMRNNFEQFEIDCYLGLICQYFMSAQPQVASTFPAFHLKCQYEYHFSILSLQGVRNPITGFVSGVTTVI